MADKEPEKPRVGFIDVQVFTLVSSIAGGYLLLQVPQISNLWWQWPNSGLELLGFLAFLAILIVLYPITLIWLWQRTLLSVYNEELRQSLITRVNRHPLLKRTSQFALVLPRAGTRILFLAARAFAPVSSGKFGIALIFAIVGLGIWLLLRKIEFAGIYLLMSAYARMCGFWMLLLALWLYFGRRFGVEVVLDDSLASLTDEKCLAAKQQRVWRTAGRVLSWLAITSTIGELFWIAADFQISYASFRLYSVWAAFHIPASVVGFMILVDMAQILTGSRVRNYLVLAILFLVFIPSIVSDRIQDPQKSTGISQSVAANDTESGRVIEAKSENPPIDETWLTSFEKRIDSRPDGPAVVVAASGGGSRAALFSALVLQHLANQPMEWKTTSTSTDESTAPPGRSDIRSFESNWANQIVLMSSVSGGSLTTARFIADPQLGIKTVSSLNYTSETELWQRTRKKLEEWTRPPDGDLKAALKPDPSVAQDKEEVARLKKILDVMVKNDSTQAKSLKDDNTSEAIETSVGCAFTSQLADDMAADFMAPILRGVLTPFASRGDILYQFWERRFNWEGIEQNNSLHPTRPLAVINTTDVETGRRVIVGFPPLPRGLLSGAPKFPSAMRQSTYSADRSTTFDALALADFSPASATSLSLTRSVRLSSNFPWGFGIQDLDERSRPSLASFIDAPSARGQDKRESLALIDGGVVDNTGIDSIAAIFDSLMLRAESDPFGTAARIIDKLRRRGVVFVEIDSGAKPTSSSTDDSLLEDILAPLNALNNASYTNSLRIGDNLINDMLLKFSASPLAANLSSLPFGQLGTVNPYFKNLDDTQVRAALGIVFPGTADLPRALQSVYHFRFSCNHSKETRADVMTAFALGPDDKAVVYAMFLSESQKWAEWASSQKTKYKAYQEFYPGAKSSIGDLSKDRAEQLAYQLVDRIRNELQLLKQTNGVVAGQLEKEKRLKRVVTMLIGMRTLSDIDSAWDKKSELWLDLAEMSAYLDSAKLAQIEEVATVGTGPNPTAQSAAIELFPEQLEQLFNKTSGHREKSRWAKETNAEVLTKPIVQTNASAEPPLLRDAILEKSQESRNYENQKDFYKSKR
jgi:Patatin-like phospholipase